MSVADILNYYEDVKEDLKFQGISSVRIKIMVSLSDGSKKTKDLRELTGIPASTILHGINELEKQKLISRKGDDFFLSEVGIISAFKLIDMIRTHIVLKNTNKLWLNHDIKAIPKNLLVRIGDLSNSKLIEVESDHMFKTHEIHTHVVINSKEIKGVSPIFYPDYTENFMKLLKNNVDVKLVLTESVLKKTIESLNHSDLNEFKRLLSENKLKIWEIKEDVKVAFTITDKAMTLGLFSVNGMYDCNKILVSDHEDSITWGNDLFDYYIKKAIKIDLGYFNSI